MIGWWWPTTINIAALPMVDCIFRIWCKSILGKERTRLPLIEPLDWFWRFVVCMLLWIAFDCSSFVLTVLHISNILEVYMNNVAPLYIQVSQINGKSPLLLHGKCLNTVSLKPFSEDTNGLTSYPFVKITKHMQHIYWLLFCTLWLSHLEDLITYDFICQDHFDTHTHIYIFTYYKYIYLYVIFL